MDPNAALEELRLLRSDYDRYGASMGDESVDRMMELGTALDGWLSRGGFLPDDWGRK